MSMCLRGLQTRALVRGISEYIRSLVLGIGLMFANVTSATIMEGCQIQHWKEHLMSLSFISVQKDDCSMCNEDGVGTSWVV